MVEAVCFETDHRYVKSIHNEGYVCLKCRAFISLAEFEKRANTRWQYSGKPIGNKAMTCPHYGCGAWQARRTK